MENKVNSCLIPDCQNTSSQKPLYPFLVDINDINSWLLGIGSPVLLNNVPEDNRRVCEQYFLCTDHMNFLDSIKDVEKMEKTEEKEGNYGEEDEQEHEEKEESAPDCLSQQLSTLSVSQPRNEDPEDGDSIIDILEAEKSEDFIELKNFCSQNLESILSLIPEDSTNVCRLCGKGTDDAIQIFSEENEGSEITLLEKIRYYLPINLEENDDLPKVICQECSELLQKSHDLAMRSLATEDFFTRSLPEEELKDEKNDTLETLAIIPVNPENLITSTQTDNDENDVGGCSQETLSDVVFECSQSSLITSDEDEGPFTKFEGLKQLRTCGKKRPLSQDTQCESGAKKTRGEPVFEKSFKCNSCSASSTDEETMKFHKHRHRLNKPVLFWCNLCATEFPKESIFTNHVLSAHKKESQDLSQAHKCTNCTRVYSLKANALSHYLGKCAVNGIQDLGTKKIAEEVYIRYAYICEYCWKGFAYVSSLNQHRNKEHPSGLPWNGQMYIDETEKRERIMDIFGIKTAFACKFCAHIFTSLENYIYHGNEHADGVFKCTTCDKSFSLFEEFKEHRETKHDYRIVFRETTRENLTSSLDFGGELEEKDDGEGTGSRFKMIMESLYGLGGVKSLNDSINSS